MDWNGVPTERLLKGRIETISLQDIEKVSHHRKGICASGMCSDFALGMCEMADVRPRHHRCVLA
jgi:hypothetical protein